MHPLDPVSPERAEFLWKTAVEDLRTEYPPEYPVWVQRRVLNDCFGNCTFDLESLQKRVYVARCRRVIFGD